MLSSLIMADDSILLVTETIIHWLNGWTLNNNRSSSRARTCSTQSDNSPGNWKCHLDYRQWTSRSNNPPSPPPNELNPSVQDATKEELTLWTQNTLHLQSRMDQRQRTPDRTSPWIPAKPIQYKIAPLPSLPQQLRSIPKRWGRKGIAPGSHSFLIETGRMTWHTD